MTNSKFKKCCKNLKRSKKETSFGNVVLKHAHML